MKNFTLILQFLTLILLIKNINRFRQNIETGYYYKMRLKIGLILIVFSLASAKIGVNLGKYAINLHEAECLSQNYKRVIGELVDQYGTFNRNFDRNYYTLKDGGVTEVDARVTLLDILPPLSTCSLITEYLPSSFQGIVWLSVGAAKWTLETSERLSFLERFVDACKSRGLKIGIYSSLQKWKSSFGSETACTDTLRDLPQWYFHDNKNPDFADFGYASFGRWRKPTMKEYKENEYIYGCGFNVVGLEYYE